MHMCSSVALHTRRAPAFHYRALQDRVVLPPSTQVHPEVCTGSTLRGDSLIPCSEDLSGINSLLKSQCVSEKNQFSFSLPRQLHHLCRCLNFYKHCRLYPQLQQICSTDVPDRVALCLLFFFLLFSFSSHLPLCLCVHECSSDKQVLSHFELITKNPPTSSRPWEGGVSVASHSVMGPPFLLRSPCSSCKDQITGKDFWLSNGLCGIPKPSVPFGGLVLPNLHAH